MELVLYSSKDFRVSSEDVHYSKIGSSDGVNELSKSPTDSCHDSPGLWSSYKENSESAIIDPL